LTRTVKYGMLVEKEKVVSHPDPLYDPDNAMEDDMNYDDYNDFYGESLDYDDYNDDRDYDEDNSGEVDWNDDYDDSMDGDHDSAMTSAGWGTDENYGHYDDGREDFHSDDGYGYYED
jgi:hypothetical protein